VSSEHVSNGTAETNGSNGSNGTNSPEWQRMQRLALMAGLFGIGVFAAVGAILFSSGESGSQQFFSSYLTAWTFWLSLPIGSLGLIGIQFVTGASWGVLLRRPFEAATRTFPLMAVLFIPIAFSVFNDKASPYPWSKAAESLTNSEAEIAHLQEKFDSWCNAPGFVVRVVGYFAIWGVLILCFNKWGRRVEQSNDPRARRLSDNLAGPTIVLFALINMFAATDFVMSTDLGFSSTMFPLIYCINQMLISFLMAVAVFLTLSPQPPIKNVLRPKFQIDMGSFMLGLTMIWSYMNFSQYMLIWIGNIAEEIPYYLYRRGGEWQYVAYVLCACHFAIPFVLLLFRDVKLHRKRLRAMAIFILIMCAVDVIWWIEPSYKREGPPYYLVMDVAALVGIGGIWGWVFLGQLKKYPILPTNYIGQLPGAHHAH